MPCPASTKLMRTSQSGQWDTTVSTTSVLLVPYDKNRVSLIISPPASALISLSLRNDATLTHGIILTSTAQPLVLTLGDHGALVMGPIFAIRAAGSITVTCWDTSVGPIEK